MEWRGRGVLLETHKVHEHIIQLAIHGLREKCVVRVRLQRSLKKARRASQGQL